MICQRDRPSQFVVVFCGSVAVTVDDPHIMVYGFCIVFGSHCCLRQLAVLRISLRNTVGSVLCFLLRWYSISETVPRGIVYHVLFYIHGCAAFLHAHCRDGERRITGWQDGTALGPGFLDDYALLAAALLALAAPLLAREVFGDAALTTPIQLSAITIVPLCLSAAAAGALAG